MVDNYFEHLIQSYPDRAKYLEWFKWDIDARVYFYGENFKNPYEGLPILKQLRTLLGSLYRELKMFNKSYKNACITDAYFKIEEYLKKEGIKTLPLPSINRCMSKETNSFLRKVAYSDFNFFLSDDFLAGAKRLEVEVENFLNKNNTPFLLMANDMTSMNRIFIDIAKRMNIPTGIFLHGLPGRYNSKDDSRADFLFVWGDKIRDNYILAGSKSKVITVGHPNYSKFTTAKNFGQNKNKDILVLSLSAVPGQPSDSTKYNMAYRGIEIHHITAVETALKNLGYNHATLRLHPSQNPHWYEKFIDKNFYRIDYNTLHDTLGDTSFVIGPISTVMIDAINLDIPYYPFILNHEGSYKMQIVPPFTDSNFPISNDVESLCESITKGNSVRTSHLDGYIYEDFDIKKIINVLCNGI